MDLPEEPLPPATRALTTNSRRRDLMPPPLVLLFVGSIGTGVLLGRSALMGALVRRFPLWILVLAQGFRLPLEILMHQAAEENVLPTAMSFEGYSFDVVTGTSAILVALALRAGASETPTPPGPPTRAAVQVPSRSLFSSLQAWLPLNRLGNFR